MFNFIEVDETGKVTATLQSSIYGENLKENINIFDVEDSPNQYLGKIYDRETKVFSDDPIKPPQADPITMEDLKASQDAIMAAMVKAGTMSIDDVPAASKTAVNEITIKEVL